MMPAEWLGLRCRFIFMLMAVLLFVVPANVETQTGRVVLTGTVSETVTLSVAPTFSQNNVTVVNIGGNTVRITASGDDPVIHIPLLVRSNTSFKITAVFDSQTAELKVTDVHPTGSLVSPQAVSGFKSSSKFDLKGSGPFLVASGPRVSFGGTLDSPNNALEITLLIRLTPQRQRESPVQLTLVATAGSPIQ
jgi:hypothetical protein